MQSQSIFYFWPPTPPLSPPRRLTSAESYFHEWRGRSRGISDVSACGSRAWNVLHCCCFVVNLVRGSAAARAPPDALHQPGQVSTSPPLDADSATFTHSCLRTRVHRGEAVWWYFFFRSFILFYFLFCSFFLEDLLTNWPSSHGDMSEPGVPMRATQQLESPSIWDLDTRDTCYVGVWKQKNRRANI